MYCGRDFSPQQSGESEVFGFDFVNDLDPEEEVISAIWTMTMAHGVDSTPNRLRGVPFVVVPRGSTRMTGTIHRVGGLIPGNTYALGANVMTTFGNSVALHSHVLCITSALAAAGGDDGEPLAIV